MASQKGTDERDIPPEEQVVEELEGENESEKPTSEVVTKEESGKKSKKKRAKKKQEQETGASVSSAEATAMRSMRELLTQLGVSEQTDGEKSHAFWDTQPVPKLDDKVEEYGPIEVDKDSIRQHPLTLPAQFEWDIVDVQNDEQLLELYNLLNGNYVEDDDNLFRFDYSMDFLRWALTPPGWRSQWHCGVRVSANHKLVGFISAIPAHIRIKEHQQLMVEINFLCVHKKLRSKRMAPVLIREITRRVNLEGIFQATYTAGVLLPKPIAACRYWHRSLNPRKLVDIQFSQIPRNMTMQRMMRLYRLPEEVKTPGVRPMQERDVEDARCLLNHYLEKFKFAPVYTTKEEFRHWFMPRSGVIDSFVVEDSITGHITDMFSFYHLPSTVVRHKTHKKLHSTYSFYNVSTKTPLKDLMFDALVAAKSLGCDVFNALDLMDNKTVLEELKFGVGDGNLHYYLYNYKCPELKPEEVSLVLL